MHVRMMMIGSLMVAGACAEPGALHPGPRRLAHVSPPGSTGYTVEVIDSTSTPHGATDWRALNAGQGLGYGTFVLFADSAGTIVASRWSPSDSNNNDTTIHPLAIGGLQ